MTGPEDFAKQFAGAFGRQDAAELAQFLAEDADVLTLTGSMADSAALAEATFAQEFSGVFATARLVSGRNRLRVLGPGAAIVTQRFVVSGARDDQGAELPRFSAVLSAVLTARSTGWQAVSLTFSATGQ